MNPNFFLLFFQRKKKRQRSTKVHSYTYFKEFINLTDCQSLVEVEWFEIRFYYTHSPTQTCFKAILGWANAQDSYKHLGTAGLGTELRNQDTVFHFLFQEHRKQAGRELR